jgi:DNA processing protein
LSAAAALINPDEAYDEFLKSGAKIITVDDAYYPPALKSISDPPFLLFYRGVLPGENDICLALIGSRRATEYGRQVGFILSRDLALKNIWIISGMARGIDSVCHQGALSAGGKTLAVVGSGLDICYPRENKALMENIAASGAVVSELPLGTAPASRNFPARNRIISGLSCGIVVVEAGEKSGTLHTVNSGLAQGKDVFAVPGPVNSPLSKGTNSLIMQGCKTVTRAEDIYGEYIKGFHAAGKNAVKDTQKKPADDSPENALESNILNALAIPTRIDDLSLQMNMPVSSLAATLTLMEIKGKIKKLPGNYYHAVINSL